MFGWAISSYLDHPPTSLLEVWGDFCCLQIANYIYIILGMGGQPVKKILVSARGISTLQVEVKFLHIRTKIPINRKGATALTVFLLSFLLEYAVRLFLALDAVHRLPIWIIQKNSDWR